MTRHLSMLKTYIRLFVSTQRYDTLIEILDVVRMREIDIEIQTRELWHAPVQS